MLVLILLSLVASSVSDTLICTNGFTLVNSAKCLKLYSIPSRHRYAEDTCGSFGGTLVTIRNAIDNRAVSTFVGNTGLSYWIGVFCLSNDPSTCYLDDDQGTASAYSNFAGGFPNVDLGGCVYSAASGTLAGKWISGECEDVEMAFVCEIPPTRADPCAHNYNGYCYLPSHENATSASLPFTSAQAACHQNCAELVSIHSPRENAYIQNLYSTANVTSAFLIGALTTAPLTPYWIDQSRWDYGHVSPRSGSSGSCFQMSTGIDGTWYQVDCKASQYFLCKRPTGTVCNSTPPPPVIVTPAPTNPSGCNSTSLFDSGYITSPSYPSTLPAHYCVYYLSTLGAYRIGLYFTEFNAYQSYTSVNVYDSNGSRLATLTSSYSPPPTYYSTSNKMTISSYVSNSVGYRGWAAKFLSF
uniref:SCP domain-containing protein n=1 Tax=Caenorhabditis tropicalis TaxID=1561998 RepID=A0A1I7UDN3_9PELO